jgi:hypothetical protein
VGEVVNKLRVCVRLCLGSITLGDIQPVPLTVYHIRYTQHTPTHAFQVKQSAGDTTNYTKKV